MCAQLVILYNSPFDCSCVLGEERNKDLTVAGLEVRTAPQDVEPWIRSYGLIDGGLEAMRAAWPRLNHTFSIRRDGEIVTGENSPEPKEIVIGHHRFSNNLLNQSPVDMLTVEQGYIQQPPVTYERQAWEKLIAQTKTECHPRVVVEIWPSNAQLWSKGPACNLDGRPWNTCLDISGSLPQMSELRLSRPGSW
jgi:hypothetical protein